MTLTSLNAVANCSYGLTTEYGVISLERWNQPNCFLNYCQLLKTNNYSPAIKLGEGHSDRPNLSSSGSRHPDWLTYPSTVRPFPPLADMFGIFPNVGFTDALPLSSYRPGRVISRWASYGRSESTADGHQSPEPRGKSYRTMESVFSRRPHGADFVGNFYTSAR